MDMRLGAHTSQSPREYTKKQVVGKKGGSAGASGTDLLGSPSLPMLSPGRPGARNWVTFLHGGTVQGF